MTPDPRGLKTRQILKALRGPEGPLFHSTLPIPVRSSLRRTVPYSLTARRKSASIPYAVA
jgi:hypothetical protein